VRELSPEEFIYQEYPRKEGRRKALARIDEAVARIRKGEGVMPPIPDKRDAQAYLLRRARLYAQSPAGSRADKTLIPHPATWFFQGRYLDDESNWQLTGEVRNAHGKPAPDNPGVWKATQKTRDEELEAWYQILSREAVAELRLRIQAGETVAVNDRAIVDAIDELEAEEVR
jgi:hypothetical protein